jgi:succinoglycan biosynthesis protein ExoA
VEEAGATGADSVVVGMRTVGMTCFQRAVAAAQNSWLGTGGSGHRTRAVPGYVDHGHHALMRISAFRAAGGYDETFTHNEDAELDLRLREKGFRIWLTDRVGLVYFPRDTVGALFRQYRNYGRGRARTQLKHRARPRIRQMLPALVLPAATAALLAAPVGIVQGEPGWTVVATPALGWIAACGLGGLALAAMRGERCAVFAGPAAAVMHLAWSTGFWSGLLRPGLSR